jgi:hypothetical protein
MTSSPFIVYFGRDRTSPGLTQAGGFVTFAVEGKNGPLVLKIGGGGSGSETSASLRWRVRRPFFTGRK